MQSKITLLFILVLPFGLKLKAKGSYLQGRAQINLVPTKTINIDSVRHEFNLKKKNTKNLIRDKSSETMLTYYQFYLQEKDQSRADTLMNELLKKENAVYYRYKISLISYSYTSDSKTQMLFLSDPARLKEYRTYLLKYDISTLKSNTYIRAHYFNLVALDSTYYQIAPDSLVEIQMAHHYNSLAWYSILTQKLNHVEYYLNQSIKYDPKSKYPYSNLPLLLLLEGHYQQARPLYLKYKDLPFDRPGSTFKDEFLEDFKELAQEGITNSDIKKITRLLNTKSRK